MAQKTVRDTQVPQSNYQAIRGDGVKCFGPVERQKILANQLLQRNPTSALQQTKHLHNLGQFENRIVWAKFLRLRLLLSICEVKL